MRLDADLAAGRYRLVLDDFIADSPLSGSPERIRPTPIELDVAAS